MSAISKSGIQVYKCLFGLDLHEIFRRATHRHTHAHIQWAGGSHAVGVFGQRADVSVSSRFWLVIVFLWPASGSRSTWIILMVSSHGAPNVPERITVTAFALLHDVCLCGGTTGSHKSMIEEATVDFNKPTKHNFSPQGASGIFGIHKVILDIFFLSPDNPSWKAICSWWLIISHLNHFRTKIAQGESI